MCPTDPTDPASRLRWFLIGQRHAALPQPGFRVVGVAAGLRGLLVAFLLADGETWWRYTKANSYVMVLWEELMIYFWYDIDMSNYFIYYFYIKIDQTKWW